MGSDAVVDAEFSADVSVVVFQNEKMYIAAVRLRQQ
jgi:hypothetical protein